MGLTEQDGKLHLTCAKKAQGIKVYARFSYSRFTEGTCDDGALWPKKMKIRGRAEDVRAKYSYLRRKEACFSVIQIVCSLQNECILNW